MISDTYELRRFVDAQTPVFDAVLAELTAGRKRTHWMWFIFPQIDGLGFSAMAKLYAIKSLAEAQAYLRHEILGPRLQTCTELVNRVEGRTAYEIFSTPDDRKFHSSITLFSRVEGAGDGFRQALVKYFGGMPDEATLAHLG